MFPTANSTYTDYGTEAVGWSSEDYDGWQDANAVEDDWDRTHDYSDRESECPHRESETEVDEDTGRIWCYDHDGWIEDYDPTPQERWQVTTPDEVYWNGED